jgi:hypothetical protein
VTYLYNSHIFVINQFNSQQNNTYNVYYNQIIVPDRHNALNVWCYWPVADICLLFQSITNRWLWQWPVRNIWRCSDLSQICSHCIDLLHICCNIGDVYKPFTSDWQAVNKKNTTKSFFFIPTIEWFSNLGLDRLNHDLFNKMYMFFYG